ncbi:hypothetical protein ACFFMP_07810 [Pseudoroseomonas cervicalis]|uniref:Uncharacterized protein n=1 Tax=Pseudoroseomonas cervicalis ATCC 49957 TaxID=525371 RepID=D5RT44_9PROT|nr:hypothetical protein HMPREF0731_4256 [Pseudoroseomonas cervicalis ATCC 49957]
MMTRPPAASASAVSKPRLPCRAARGVAGGAPRHAAARGPDSGAFDRAVDVQVSRPRRKLRSAGDERIRTIRNGGNICAPATRRL